MSRWFAWLRRIINEPNRDGMMVYAEDYNQARRILIH